ncbi:uncharacterized protein [Blastocystis hominis]|uniref:Peptidase S54 rhomboid domain-containing protein n=1 Tax=Blastocystis hominis TaxID=12968 RepID=D8M1G6_BLAHO|nr:uncharacterized protein [Blastocystis hominis]CBK21905.2 unnamed protein product [Blastocystis hominis]|eukprot:XP_012895953.1 uncharacterized protein [Blastocystis hominis]
MEAWHIAANMIGLLSFAPLVRNKLGTDHFMFFYLSSCFFSSYCSWIWRCVRLRSAVSSLGASGAVYAVTALAAFFHDIDSALLCVCIFEIISLFRNSPFDNVAHLSGILWGFGEYYGDIGEDMYTGVI